jgi:type 1 glutamine amidotransferase
MADDQPEGSTKPLRVLIITGGCCHDYDFQSKALQLAAAERDMEIDWTIVNKGGKGTRAQIELYDNPTWSEGFDVVVHNECFADTADPDYMRKITEPHKAGVNAVVIHCAMHTYRSAKIDDWREFLGVTSKRHEHQSNYPVKVVAKDHPIMKNFPDDYTTPKDELYLIEHVWPETKVLATSVSERTQKTHPVFWVGKYGKARVFGTTYGHSNETFADETFQETVLRGIQWAGGRL